LKKLIDNKRLVQKKTTSAYQQEFRSLFMALSDNPDYNAWMDIYKKISFLGAGNEESDSPEMQEIFQFAKE